MKSGKPDRRVIWTWMCCALVAAIPLAAISVWLRRWHIVPPILSVVFTALWCGLLLLTLAVYIPLRYRRYAYTAGEDCLCVTSGVLLTVEHRMPLSSVRHVTLLQGPLERHFDTAFLWVSGAGGWIVLEGLPLAEAEAIRSHLFPS